MRSQKATRRQRPQPTVFASLYGTVRVYTPRHIHGCALLDARDNRCSCPKWIYSHHKGGKPVQKSAGTPSFTEACEKAQKELKSFDPEIRAARAILEPAADSNALTVEGALAQYLTALRRRRLNDDYLGGIIVPVFNRRKPRKYERGRRALNVSLLDFLDRRFPGRAVALSEITTSLLDEWTAVWQSNDLTSKQWRTTASAFFKWAAQRGYLKAIPVFDKGQTIKAGNRCGHFTDLEYSQLLATLPFYHSKTRALPANYAERLGCFMDLGRWAGMAVCDIVLFRPKEQLAANNVLTYRRLKIKKRVQLAQVLLDPAVAARLRSIPLEPGVNAEQPFRFTGIAEDRSRGIWRERFQKLCEKAGITEIETEIGTRVRPHPHMLRDTCAISALLRGVRLENVSKMLGHATTQMTQRSYLTWCKERLDYSIEDQRAALARAQTPAVDPATIGDGVRRTLVN
jgi:integrase